MMPKSIFYKMQFYLVVYTVLDLTRIPFVLYENNINIKEASGVYVLLYK